MPINSILNNIKKKKPTNFSERLDLIRQAGPGQGKSKHPVSFL